ncbi:MAG: DNA polymerase III subunit alpha [Rickettsiales bacterium]|jgi:DNA polymerase-3 subunit alpha|nr:DNA polymerase III subunit alpha [Rickettsiales bacterium]
MSPKFIHLRSHTAYSLAEGAIRIPALAKLCAERKMPACAVADTNNIYGVPEFCKYMSDAGVQPIIGTQISIDFGLKDYADIILLVQNETGYKNLLKIASSAYMDKQQVETPHVKFEYLKDRVEGIIALSGGVDGPLGKLILLGQDDKAEEICLELNTVFKDRFYIELQRHGLEDEEAIEAPQINLAYKHNIPLVATNECFFDSKDMFVAHDIMLCITAIKYFDDPDRRHETEEHYFKTEDEMVELFKDLPEAVANTVAIAKRCSFKLKKSKPLLPHVAEGVDENELLILNARAGLEERLNKAEIPNEERQPYLDRLSYEIGVITQMGFAGYFLIVADFIGWAKKNEIPVGPGRGSGAGSVVAWSLKITDLNPLTFGLLFERFLNPDRVSMPDFDIDFCQDRRGEVIKYIQAKYGFDSVGQIITFGKLQSKAVIKDVGRVMRVPYGKCDDLAKLIPFRLSDDGGIDVPVNIPNTLKYNRDFKAMVESDDQYRAIINIAVKLEGLYRNPGLHAAGVVIGDRPLTELAPLYKDDKSDIPATAYNMKFIEDTGLIKYDFLGLKTLTIIKHAVDMIEKIHGIKIDIDHIPMDDQLAYELMASGNTAGVFQLESSGMINVLREMKPNRIEDIIAVEALYRPGPMENIPTYIRRKQGEPVEYLHPKMEPILNETYGIMVYQEQVMEIGRSLAGYTLGAADLLRRAMGKKIREEMEKQRAIFVKGCKEHSNIDADLAGRIFDLMEKFANYGFNKSHAACYAWITYQTAYLKSHYEPEFMAATMSYDMMDDEKLSLFADSIRRKGIKLLRPDINNSFDTFSVEDGAVRFAMAAVKSVGVGVVQGIVEEREKNGKFKSIPEFMSRVNRMLVSRKMLENLTCAGGFDSLEPNRAKMLANIEYILAQMMSMHRDRETNQSSLFDTSKYEIRDDIKLSEAAPMPPVELLKREVEVIGFYLSAHPLDMYEPAIKALRAINIDAARKVKEEGKITIACTIDKLQLKLSKAGKRYYSLSVSDKTGSTSLFVSDRSYESNRDNLKDGLAVAIFCDVRVNERGPSVFVSTVERLSLEKAVSGIVKLRINTPSAVVGVKKALATIPIGYTSVALEVEESGKTAVVALPQKYGINAESLSILRQIGGVEVRL